MPINGIITVGNRVLPSFLQEFIFSFLPQKIGVSTIAVNHQNPKIVTRGGALALNHSLGLLRTSFFNKLKYIAIEKPKGIPSSELKRNDFINNFPSSSLYFTSPSKRICCSPTLLGLRIG